MEDRIPYTYLIKHIPSGKVYYGCRYAKGCHPDEFFKKYFTTQKYVSEMIKEDGTEQFQTQIRKIFTSVEQCRKWEHKVLRRIKAVYRDDFINKTDNISISPEQCRLGQKKQIGKKKNWQKEGLDNIRKANSRPRTEEEKRNLSLKQKGVKRGKRKFKESDKARENKRLGHLGKQSGMKDKKHIRCQCLICHQEFANSFLTQHYQLKHSESPTKPQCGFKGNTRPLFTCLLCKEVKQAHHYDYHFMCKHK